MTLSALLDQIATQDWIEWLGLVTGILYVILAAYERPSCWILGVISSAAIAWKSFSDYKLIADGILQLFYIVMGFIGLWNWMKGKAEGHQKPIIVSPLKYHALAVGICFVISIPLSWILIKYASARFGYLDTLISVASVWATVLLIKKDLHNWIYWIVLDFMLIFLYYVSQGYLFSILFVVYTLISFWGYREWKSQSVLAQDIGKVV